MPGRALVRRPFRARPRTGTNWARFVDAQETTIALGTKVLLASFVLSNAGIGEVIRRTRGVLRVISDQTTTVEGITGAFGMCLVTDLALAAGAVSIPGPVTDASDDLWFVWEPLVGHSRTTNVSAAAVPADGITKEFDSKAMRRVEEGYAIAVMVENNNVTFGFDITIGLSLLSSRIG